MIERDRIAAERDRFRAALEKIASEDSDKWCNCCDSVEIALDALDPPKEPCSHYWFADTFHPTLVQCFECGLLRTQAWLKAQVSRDGG